MRSSRGVGSARRERPILVFSGHERDHDPHRHEPIRPRRGRGQGAAGPHQVCRRRQPGGCRGPTSGRDRRQGAQDVRWSDDGKHGALHAINAWLISEGTTGMPDEMPELRDELMRDLRLPPFDEEIPYDAT